MRHARRIADALTAAAFGAGVVGAALWLWRPRVDVAPLSPRLPAAAAAAPAPTGDDLPLRVVATNVFDASRAAPTARWTPPDAEAVTTGAALPSGLAPDPVVAMETAPSALPALAEPVPEVAPPEAPVRARDARVPALFGIVIGGEGARALLRLDARIPGAQLYAEGARAGGWRVARVEADRVLLDGPGGTTTLRMSHASAPRPTPRPGDAP